MLNQPSNRKSEIEKAKLILEANKKLRGREGVKGLVEKGLIDEQGQLRPEKLKGSLRRSQSD